MRTWTLVAAGLVAASVGTTAAVLPDARTAVEQQDLQKKKPATKDRADDEGLDREIRRHVEGLGGRDVQIGVAIRDLEGDQARTMSGAVVSDVREDSPAAKAGLVAGDIVVEFDGEKVRSARHLSRIVGETPSGRSVKIVVQREGRRVDLQVTPEARMALSEDGFQFRQLPHRSFEFNAPGFKFDGPEMKEFFEQHGRGGGDEPDAMVIPRGRGRLGIGIQDLTPQLGEYFGTKDGVLVTSVEADSPAAKAGLKAGDVITAVGDTAVGSPSDLMRAVRRTDEGSELSITYMRDKKSATATAKLEPRREQRKGAPI